MNPVGRWAALAGAVALGAVAAAGVVLAVYAVLLFKDLPGTGELAEYRPPTSTRAYAWDGTLIAELGQERRIFTPYDQIPPLLIRAFLAAEDHNFFQHGGVDVSGLGRAAMTRDLMSAMTGRRLQGGSTITQQVAKNILLSNEVTFGRKIKEAILAQRLEQTLPKSRILELYLNEIRLGYQSYGVGAAAYNYFGKPLHDLDLAQMAYLAALPKGPNNYHPIRHKAAAMGRRNWILGEMSRPELGQPRRRPSGHARGPGGPDRADARPLPRRRLFRGGGAAARPRHHRQGRRERRPLSCAPPWTRGCRAWRAPR